MGIEAIYRRPNTSKPAPGTRSIRICCAGLKIERPNQVWAMDITYIPMARGFVYLAAVVDWFSRRVLAWRRVDHDGGGFLRRGAGGGLGQTRQAGDLQHRSGQPVHQRGLHRRADERTPSPSAWTARAPGATTCSSSGCGVVKYEEVYLRAYRPRLDRPLLEFYNAADRTPA
jgi:hypothetical protein